MKKISYTFEKLEVDLFSIVRQIALDEWKPDIILGPTRGGLVPAVMLSHYYDIPMHPIDISLRDFKSDGQVFMKLLPELKQKKVLIVDDIVDSGETFSVIKEIQEKIEREIRETFDLKFATCYYNIGNDYRVAPEYYANELNKLDEDVWIDFPFENWFRR